jgi:hypothetical protein
MSESLRRSVRVYVAISPNCMALGVERATQTSDCYMINSQILTDDGSRTSSDGEMEGHFPRAESGRSKDR